MKQIILSKSKQHNHLCKIDTKAKEPLLGNVAVYTPRAGKEKCCVG